MLLNIFRLLIFLSIIFCQVTEVDLNIDYRNTKNNTTLELYIEELQNDIKFYITSNEFLNHNHKLNITLDINMIIQSISNDIVNSHIVFSNRKDQIIFSDGIDFKYSRGDNLLYSNSYNSLSSFLDYNIFIIIAGELDKYQYKGGENYYIRSEDIAFQGTTSEYPRKWEKRLKKCKEQKNNLYLRNIKFLYNSMDKYIHNLEDEFDENIVINYLKNIYDELVNIHDEYGYDKDTLLFLSSYSKRLIEICLDYDAIYLIKFLIMYDEDNAEFYKEFLD